MLFDDVTNLTWLYTDKTHSAGTYAIGAGTEFDDGFSLTDGRMTYPSAQAWVAQLSIVNEDNGAMISGWRLPRINILNPLDNEQSGRPGGFPVGGFAWFGQLYDSPHPLSSDILSVEGHLVIEDSNPILAWAASYSGGGWLALVSVGDPPRYVMQGYALAVHDGDVSAVPLPLPGAFMLAGLAALSSVCHRRQAPQNWRQTPRWRVLGGHC